MMSLILSVSVAVAQTEWSAYPTPNSVKSLVLTDNEVILFGQIEGYRTSLPLPLPTSVVNWTSFAIPGNGCNGALNAAIVNGNLFILLYNGDLWKQGNDNQWTKVYDGINNIAYSPTRLIAWSGNQIYELLPNGNWDLALAPESVEAIAFRDESIFVFCSNRTTYYGTSINNIEYFSVIEDMHCSEAVMNSSHYVVVGNVVGDFAAWYQSPQNQVFKYTHILTAGNIYSATAFHDTLWAAGWVGDIGTIFSTSDITKMQFFPQPIFQIRSNSFCMGAVSYSTLYMHGGTVIAGVSKHQLKEKAELLISPNPINNGELRLKSTVVCEKTLLSVDGKEITKFNIAVGDNSFLLPNLKPGVYLLAPGNYKIVVYECH